MSGTVYEVLSRYTQRRPESKGNLFESFRRVPNRVEEPQQTFATPLSTSLIMNFFSVALLLLTNILDPACALPQHQEMIPRTSSGCGKKPFLPGITQYRALKSSSKDRSYSFHLPSAYDADTPYPVVLGFHGSSSIGAFFELDTKLSQARYSSNKIMIYPNGIGGSWAGPTYHDGSTVADDIQFMQDIISDVKRLFCVDENKFFSTG